MRNKVITTLLFLFFLSSVFISCKKESPVEPTITGNGFIIGKVIDDVREEPLQNVNISTNPATSYVTTDQYGNFQIANVDSGRYRVTAYKSGYIAIYADISLSHGDTSVANFLLERDPEVVIPEDTILVGSILGNVMDADTYEPIQQVSITTNPVTGSFSTNSSGQFFITNLTAGVYKVYAKKNLYDTTYVSVNVVLGDTTIADIFLTKKDTTTIETTGSVSGYILNSVTGLPIKNASISTSPASSVVNSDSTGFFKISDIEAGTYNLTVSKLGYTSQTIEIRAQAGRNTQADFNLLPTTGSISGKVTNSFNGYAIFGALIKTEPETKTAHSERDGVFELSNIPVGVYKVIVSHASYYTDTTTVNLEPGMILDVAISLNSVN